MKGKKILILLLLISLLGVFFVSCARDSALTVKFYVDGELLETYRVEKGGSLDEVPEVPEKDGYKGAWSVTDFDDLQESLQVYAVYTPNEYTVSFYVDGVLTYTRTGKNNRTIDSIPAVPEKEGYLGVWSVTNFSTVRNDTRVDALYTKKVYLATFVLPDESVAYSDITNGAVSRVPTIDQDAYDAIYKADFNYKWTAKDADGKTVPATFTDLEGDHTYYAIPYVCVTLKEENGAVLGTLDLDTDNVVSTLATPTVLKEEYDFYGWYYDKSFLEPVTYPATFAHNVSLYAKWVSVKTSEGLTVTTEGKIQQYLGSETNVYVPYKITTDDGDVLVTAVDADAFKDKTFLTSIHLPGTLTTIEAGAFDGCSELRTVYFDDGCYVRTIGDNAFRGCSELRSFTFSPETESLGQNAFDGCLSLRTLNGFTESAISSVPTAAFAGCSALSSVRFPAGLIQIGESAFEGDVSLTATFENVNALTSIGARAFALCENFAGVSAPNAEYVGEEAFVGCYSLSAITMDTSKKAHQLFSLLADVEDPDKFYSVTTDGKEYAVPRYLSTVTVVKGREDEEGRLQTGALYDLYTLKRVVIASGVKTIGERAFAIENKTLSSTAFTLELSEGLETIEREGLATRKDVRSVALPSTLTTIGEYAFYELEQLNTVTIPARNALESVGKYAFGETEWYRGMAGPVKLGPFVLGVSEIYCRNRGYSVISAEDMGLCEKIAPYAFYGNVYLTSVTVGEYVTEIGENAFASCTSIRTFTFNSNATNPQYRTLGDDILEGADALTELTVYEDVKQEKLFQTVPTALKTLRIGFGNKESQIKQDSYTSYTGIEKLYIGNGYERIEEETFVGSTALKEVHIGSTVERIEDRAFYGLSRLDTLDLSANETLEYVGASAFEGTAVAAVNFPATVRHLDAGSFKGAALTTLVLPTGLERVGESAFENNAALTTVTLNEEITEMGAYAFRSCNVRALTLPASLVNGTLGEGILSDNVYFTSLTLEEGLPVAKLFTETTGEEQSVDVPSNFTTVRLTAGKIVEREFYGFTSLQTLIVESGVTEIGKSAFEGCTGIRNVTVPATVTVIGDRAFAGCTLLASCQIDSSNSELEKTGKEIFAGDVALVYADFPLTVAETDWTGMFDGCVSLTTTSFPTSVTEIGNYAYRNCRNLTTVGMHDNVESIGDSAFEGCRAIDFDDVRFDALTTVGERAFYDCDALHGIKAENAVTIGKDAFSDCDYIEEITVTADNAVAYFTDKKANVVTLNVTTQGETPASELFGGCTALQTVMFYFTGDGETAMTAAERIRPALATLSEDVVVFVGGSLYAALAGERVHKTPTDETLFSYEYDAETLTATLKGFAQNADLTGFDGVLYVPSETTYGDAVYRVSTIGANAFDGRTDVNSVVIPAQTEIIANGAFRDCTALTDLRFESGSMLTTVGDYAFASCSALKKVAFPSSLTRVGNNAFQYDVDLASVTFYANSKLETIGEYAFQSLSALTSFLLTGPVKNIGKNAFADCERLSSFSFGGKTTIATIGSSTFNNCFALEEIVLPETVESVGQNAFKNCIKLKTVVIPNGVKTIGNNAFQASGVATLTLGRGVKEIGNNAFENCVSLTAVSIPDGVTTVGSAAFNGCSALKTLTIGGGVTSIGTNAFSSARNLESLAFNAATVKDFAENNGVFAYAGKDAGLRVTIGENVRRIPAYLFASGETTGSAPNVLSVTFEETPSTEEIGAGAFAGLTEITTLTVPVSVLAMGENVFSGCTRLTVRLEASVTPACFDEEWASGLGITPVFGSGNVNSGEYTYVLHGTYAFLTRYEGSETDVTVPAAVNGYAVKDVGAAFEKNASVVRVTIPSEVTGIGSYYDCTSLGSVSFGNAVTVIRKNAFYGCTSLTSVTVTQNVTAIGENAFYGCTALETVYVDSPTVAAQLYVTEVTERETTDVTNETIGYLTAYAFNLYVKGETTVDETAYHKVPVTMDGYDIYTKLYFAVGRTADDDVNAYMVRSRDTDDYVLYMEGTGNTREYEARALIPWYSYAAKVVTVVIGENVRQIGKTSFSDMTALENVYYNATEATYTVNKFLFDGSGKTNGMTLYVGEDVTIVPAYLMSGNVRLSRVVFAGNAVREIGAYAFNACTGLTDFILPDSVQTVGTYAVAGCSGLSSLTVGRGLTNVGARAFYGADHLTTMYFNATQMPDFVGNVYAFDSEYDAGTFGGGFTLYIGENVRSIPAYAFYGVGNLIALSVTERAALASIGREAFYDCGSIREIAVPSNLTTIAERAFAEAGALATIRFGSGAALRVIGAEAFLNTAFYRNNDNWTTAGDDATQGVLYLNNVYLVKARAGLAGDYRMSDATRVVANNAFDGCNGLEYIRIPVSVEYMGEDAFAGCSRLNTVYVMSRQVASQAETANAFGGVFRNASHVYILSSLISEQGVRAGLYLRNNFTAIATKIAFASGDYYLYTTTAWNVGKTASDTLQAYLVNDEQDRGFYVLNVVGMGNMADLSNAPWAAYRTTISKIVLNAGVTSVGAMAFSGCTETSSVTIAKTVTAIGAYAFMSCSGLETLEIPDGVTEIGEGAFANCTNVAKLSFNATNMKDLAENNMVFAMMGAQSESQTEVEIARTVTYVPAYLLFPGNGSLAGVSISGDMTPAVKSVKFLSYGNENSCEKIGDYAFAHLSGLVSLTFATGSTMNEIGKGAFEGCTLLPLVTITAGIRKVGEGAFKDCVSVTEIAFNALSFEANEQGSYSFEGTGRTNGYTLTISARATRVPSYLFEGSAYLKRLDFQESGVCEEIGEKAFEDCTSLTEIVLPDEVKTIGAGAFSGCSAVRRYVAPFIGGTCNVIAASEKTPLGYVFGTDNKAGATATVQTISDSSDRMFYVPDSLTTVEVTLYTNVFYGTFENCKYIRTVTYNTQSTVDVINLYAKDDAGKEFIADSINNGWVVEKNAFRGCESLTGVTLAPQIRTIGERGFENCKNLASFTVGENVTDIGMYAFNGCTGMTQLTFDAIACNDLAGEDAGSFVATNVFAGLGTNKEGTDVTFGTKVTRIPAFAFAVSNSLFTSPKLLSVSFATGASACRTIGTKAFYGAGRQTLASISLPSSLTSIGESAFEETAFYNANLNWQSNVLYLDGCLLKARFTTSGTETLNILNSTYIIADKALYDCRSLVTVNVPNGVKYIGEYAFANCTRMQNVQFDSGSSLIGIGAYAFKDCAVLGTWQANGDLLGISIRANVAEIGEYAFSGCLRLSTVYLDSTAVVGGLIQNDFATYGGLLQYADTLFIHKNVTSVGTYVVNAYSTTGIVDGNGYRRYIKNS